MSVELCVIHCFYSAHVLSITLGSLKYTKSQTNPAFIIIRALVFLAWFPKDLIKIPPFSFMLHLLLLLEGKLIIYRDNIIKLSCDEFRVHY